MSKTVKEKRKEPPPSPTSSGPMIIAAAIIGGAILAGSLIVNSALGDTATELQRITVALAQTRDSLEEVAKKAPAAPAQQRRRGPDPNKRHKINTAGAPAKGPPSAKIQIVEFSDFQ